MSKDTAETTIPRRTTGDVLPMSFAQELLWLLDRATPGLTAYNVPRAMRLRGTLDVEALRRAIESVVARHEILRTTYASDERGAVQIVHPNVRFELPVVDLTGQPEGERMVAAERFFLDQARTPFDIGKDPLLRGYLLQLGDDDRVLVLVTHHIASDGWSKGVMFRELSQAYEAFASGTTPAMAPLPIQYADFALWQRAQVDSGSLAEPLEYWHRRLAPPLPALELPTDFARPSVASFEGGRQAIILPNELVHKVRELAMDHGATLYMTLLAAYHTVLHRYSGQDDIITGSPIAGRNQVEVEGLIGYFANTLAMRTSFEGDPTFAELLERISENAVDAYEHEDVPFEKLVLELRAAHQAEGDTPLFSCVLTMEDTLPDELQLGDVDVTTIAIDFGMAKFDLTLLVAEQPEGLRLALWYRSDLFSAGYAERFLGHMRSVLEAAVAHPGQRVSELPLMTALERSELDGWNDTAVDEGVPATVVELFEQQAARVPSRTAVVDADGQLSYADLNARANQLAHLLRTRGTGRGATVGLLLDRSVDALVGLLGILKAGAAYVPLSVDAPAARLDQQIAEAGIRVVITNATLCEKLPTTVSRVALDTESPALSALFAENPLAAATPEDLAYVLYTSGSTGVPKGVAVTHANVVHYTRAIGGVLGGAKTRSLAALGTTTKDVVPTGAPSATEGPALDALPDGWHFGLASTLAADLGNTSLFPALLSGGTLHTLAKSVTTEPAEFAEYAATHPLDVLKLTPNHLLALVAGRTGGELAALLPRQWIVLGGEALRSDVARVLLGAGSCRVLNHYGPTETTVGVCTFEVTADSLAAAQQFGAQTVPVGMPLANTRAYIVDGNGNEQPVGIPGELLLGGAGVANGYLNRPELTAERFVQFENQKSRSLASLGTTNSGAALGTTPSPDRVYRTGDRARRLPDGTIEFRGRADEQVKVRGFRVELGEIEHVLAEHRGVAQSAVALHATPEGEQRLVAYVVPQTGGYAAAHAAKVTAGEISEWIAARLPEYMVPSAVVLLDALPITANGKVDRRALPDPEVIAADDGYVAPRTETETRLAAIWVDVLKKERIGVTESFMTLGGHSLLAIRVLGKLSRQFGVRLPLRSLFDTPTIAELAQVVDAEMDAVRQRELAAALASMEGLSDADVQRLMKDEPTETGA
jgi:non-ribosomal peptide synthetase component F/acyl carrier protein